MKILKPNVIEKIFTPIAQQLDWLQEPCMWCGEKIDLDEPLERTKETIGEKVLHKVWHKDCLKDAKLDQIASQEIDYREEETLNSMDRF